MTTFLEVARRALEHPMLLDALNRYYNDSALENVPEENLILELERFSWFHQLEAPAPEPPDPLDQLREQLLVQKASREQCRTCPLFYQTLVAADAVPPQIGPVKVLFLGLNPGTQEATEKRPFVGPAGRRLREELAKLDCPYAITNVILCHTRNATEIPDVQDVMRRCREMVETVMNAFPADIVVPLGNEAKEFCGLEGNITAISGKLQGKYLPIIHPSAVRGEQRQELFAAGFATLRRHLGQKRSLFEICHFGDKVLFIFLDEQGNKVYEIKEATMRAYVANDGYYPPLRPKKGLKEINITKTTTQRRRDVVDDY